MKVFFITGGAGFIGSNYLNKYVPLNPDVLFVNIDALTYAGNLISEHSNYRFENTNICDLPRLKSLFEEYRPKAVLHFAAESHVDMSLENPDIFIQTNVVGTHNLLQLSRRFEVERFHLVSTDEVYGSLQIHEDSFSELSPIKPRNPYSASKASAEMFVRAYHSTFGLNTIITRSSNTYGPNQDGTKLIPRFVSDLIKGEKVPLYGEGLQMREWMFVEDCIDGIETAFTKGVSGEIYNVGGGNEFTNLELTHKILSFFEKDETSISFVKDRQGHDFRYSLNVEKIRDELGWSPKVDFSTGLKLTIKSLMKNTK
jgi:dTDP-glucose 4,6-dehydratase